jgi:biopolymer transport protein ExbD
MIINLVDILAILVIFLVVTTTFKKDQPEVVINLPESKTAVTQPGSTSEASVVLYIDPKNEIFLDQKKIGAGDKVSAEALADKLKQFTGRSFAMQADEHADFGLVIKVLDAFKMAGVKNLPAFTKAPSSEEPK